MQILNPDFHSHQVANSSVSIGDQCSTVLSFLPLANFEKKSSNLPILCSRLLVYSTILVKMDGK